MRRRTKKTRNVRPGILLLLIPLGIGVVAVSIIASGLYTKYLSNLNNTRLLTPGWEAAAATMKSAQPEYARKFAYYKVKDGQTLPQLAEFFSVDAAKLASLNPGLIVPGTTIMVPPVEHRLAPAQTTGNIQSAVVTAVTPTFIRIEQKYYLRQPVVTNLPELMKILAPLGGMEQTGPLSYRLNKNISIEGDIRLDMTPETVTKLEIKSEHGSTICFCMDESTALLDGVTVSTYDSTTGKPDTNSADGRSFIRMKNGRMDVVDAKLQYLGNGLDPKLTADSPLNEGGVYGMSWRISDDRLGSQIVTGWVENSDFSHNHFGAYSFGASGMTWRSNRFHDNEVYGLDPHDDSNNALVENNIFDHNGKHGFIVSKRCQYNIIRNNTSYDNKLHGFMLHLDSAYNLIEHNVAYGNQDNFVIFHSNFNTIRDNLSYSPRSSHIRINDPSAANFITGNQLYGGRRGIYLYNKVQGTLVENNSMHGMQHMLVSHDTRDTLVASNTMDNLSYKVDKTDRLIYGDNIIHAERAAATPTPPLSPNNAILP